MEHHQNGMARKWERHYRETRTTISYAFAIFGISFAIPFIFLYPQKFAIDIFNSRLSYHIIIEARDYFTCTNGKLVGLHGLYIMIAFFLVTYSKSDYGALV